MKQLLVIGYVYPEPNSSAASRHILSIINLFLSQGWQVTFSTPAQHSQHAVDLKTMGVKNHPIELNNSSFDLFIAELNPQIVLYDRFMMEEQFGWRVEQQCPSALTILDTEDLQCLRHARHTALKAKRPLKESDLLSDISKREIASILRCDLSLIISSYEMELLKSHFKVDQALLFHLPFMVDLEKTPTASKSFSERQHFITIGNFRHAPNWDMVLYLQSIWAEIRQKLPQAELHIYGSYPPPKATALHNPKKGFYIKGWVEDAYEVMESARLCLAPIRFGAGIKGKLLDAMICQTPSITTSMGAEGMYQNEPWGGAVEDEIDAFVKRAVVLYEDETLWYKAQEHGKTILNRYYEQTSLGKKLMEKITELEENLERHRSQNFVGAMLKHHSMKSTQYMSQWIELKNRDASAK